MGTYLRPTDLNEALSALAETANSDTTLTVLAGGTDFYPARVGRAVDEPVLDISGIDALRGITDSTDHWRIGATTTWTDIIRADLPACFDGLKLAAREVGGVQIQNAGTVCGNLCNASPAADGVPPLLSLDAAVEIGSAKGQRSVPLTGFITGNRQTVLAPGELVTGLSIPKPANPACSAFLKLGARKYLVISIVMVAAVIEIADGETVAAARIAVGSCSAAARRLDALENELFGQKVSPRLADIATAAHLAPLSPIDDVRGSAGYRMDAALTHVKRVLAQLGETP